MYVCVCVFVSASVTDSEAHTQRHISDGVDTAVDGGVTDVDQVTHDGHHGGVHHTYRTNIIQFNK